MASLTHDVSQLNVSNSSAREIRLKKEKAPKLSKEERIKAREAEAAAADARNCVTVTDHNGEHVFGQLKIIQSQNKNTIEWKEIQTLNASTDEGKQVWIRARLQSMRAKGKLAFVLLRRGTWSVQGVLNAAQSDGHKDIVKYAAKVPVESIVDIHGTVRKVEHEVNTASQKDVEIQIDRFFVVSSAATLLPFQMEDAARPEDAPTVDKDGNPLPTVSQDTRLDFRYIDLRTPANHAIMRMQSRVGQYFRQFLIDRDFIEIHSPKIIPGVSEGGASVFRLNYFGTPVCLAQSPQLYKQMGIASDLFKVFEIGPVFRAEDSNTHRHLCEFVGLDFEMELKSHYSELTDFIGELFTYIFDQLNTNCKHELVIISQQYPFEPLRYKREVMTLSFPNAVKILQNALKDAGDETIVDPLADLSTPHEKLIGKMIRQHHDVDFYIIDRYPKNARPFYTMPDPNDSNYTNSYDVFIRGEEITSGSQRVHDASLLRQRAEECGIPFDNIASYVESFKYGAWPHGGAGIGLERVVMLFLGLNNIRKTSMFPRTPNRCSP